MARGLEGVKVKTVLLASWVMVPVTPGATVKVEAVMVATFMASLKVAVTTVLGHAPKAPVGGAMEITVGGIRSGFLKRSGSPHPVTKVIIKNAVNHVL
jgi:hypothetical protein